MFKELSTNQHHNIEAEINQRWTKIEQQIFECALLEEKRAVKDLLVQYSSDDKVNPGDLTSFNVHCIILEKLYNWYHWTESCLFDRSNNYIYTILLRSVCLIRKKAKASLLTIFEVCKCMHDVIYFN